MLCLIEGEGCLDKIANTTMDSLEAVGTLAAQDYPQAVMATAGVAVDLAYPICNAMK